MASEPWHAHVYYDLAQRESARATLSRFAALVPARVLYVGEMREIAEAFASAGLPAGFHLAAAEICERFDCFKDRTDPALSVATVLRALERQKSTEAMSETEKINYSP